MASLGCTVLLRIKSEISKLVAMSSRLDEVALSICSSRTVFPDENQPAMLEDADGRLQILRKDIYVVIGKSDKAK